MLVGLSRECVLAARRWKNSRVKCNWPCTSYFLCSPDPIRPLEDLTLTTLKLLWAVSLCVDDFGARLLKSKEENQDYIPVAESRGSRSPWDISVSLTISFCQNNPVISSWSFPSSPNHSLFQKKFVHWGKYKRTLIRLPTQQTSV